MLSVSGLFKKCIISVRKCMSVAAVLCTAVTYVQCHQAAKAGKASDKMSKGIPAGMPLSSVHTAAAPPGPVFITTSFELQSSDQSRQRAVMTAAVDRADHQGKVAVVIW